MEFHKIEEIEQTVWEFMRKQIGKGNIEDPDSFENVLLKYLGTFHVMPKKVEYYKEAKDDK